MIWHGKVVGADAKWSHKRVCLSSCGNGLSHRVFVFQVMLIGDAAC
jgi:hypothetical protein